VTADELRDFERQVADAFNAGKIRAPVHLDGGNEEGLIKAFETIAPDDYVFCTWRSHYKALLHGIPPERVMAEIMAGHSIALCFPEYRFYSSAIVGGTLPIALGAAMGIKRRGDQEQVHAFLGDMAALTGTFAEVHQYARAHDLPIRFIIEDNGISVCTPTMAVWGDAPAWLPKKERFEYKLPWPHSGAGVRVQF
jgi:pyruvate dehydrogenase E1 component alpha subunit